MKKIKENNNGITLIALVITIIILLILAGISISSLTGSGLFQKAQEATTKYTEAQIKEQIEIAIYNSRMNSNGMIDLEELEKGLLEIKGITKDSIEKQGEDGKLPWIVTVEDWKFKIDEDGEVTVIKGISIPKSLKIVVGSSETITATLMSGITGTINWTVDDTSIATLSSTMGDSISIRGISGGKTIITANITTLNGVVYNDKCTITVVSKVTSISVDDISIPAGGKDQLKVETSPNNVEIEELKYISDNPDLITVDEKGIVSVSSSAEVGTIATITITGKISTEVATSCKVTVIGGLSYGNKVKYGICYTDVSNKNKVYDNSDDSKIGWQVLFPGNKEEDGSYSGVTLVSTGISVAIPFDQNVNYHWSGTSEQLGKYCSEFSYTGATSAKWNRMTGIVGLTYNFANIVFNSDGVMRYGQGTFYRS